MITATTDYHIRLLAERRALLNEINLLRFDHPEQEDRMERLARVNKKLGRCAKYEAKAGKRAHARTQTMQADIKRRAWRKEYRDRHGKGGGAKVARVVLGTLLVVMMLPVAITGLAVGAVTVPIGRGLGKLAEILERKMEEKQALIDALRASAAKATAIPAASAKDKVPSIVESRTEGAFKSSGNRQRIYGEPVRLNDIYYRSPPRDMRLAEKRRILRENRVELCRRLRQEGSLSQISSDDTSSRHSSEHTDMTVELKPKVRGPTIDGKAGKAGIDGGKEKKTYKSRKERTGVWGKVCGVFRRDSSNVTEKVTKEKKPFKWTKFNKYGAGRTV